MKNLGNNQQVNTQTERKKGVDEQFERNAGVKISNKQSYNGGNGYYSLKPKDKSPNVNDHDDKTIS